MLTSDREIKTSLRETGGRGEDRSRQSDSLRSVTGTHTQYIHTFYNTFI